MTNVVTQPVVWHLHSIHTGVVLRLQEKIQQVRRVCTLQDYQSACLLKGAKRNNNRHRESERIIYMCKHMYMCVLEELVRTYKHEERFGGETQRQPHALSTTVKKTKGQTEREDTLKVIISAARQAIMTCTRTEAIPIPPRQRREDRKKLRTNFAPWLLGVSPYGAWQ